MIAVAIDGPVGAGKSSLARICAGRLGYIYVDTGALYRTVGLFCTRNNINTDNHTAVRLALESKLKLEIRLIDGTQHVYMNGEDVSEEIRTPEMSMMASKVSAIGEVRRYLVDIQRKMAEENNVIMDGRDIGTVILPNAQVKIFITAKSVVRAKRRYEELVAKNIGITFKEVYTDLLRRDYNDSHRAEAPLKQAEDAVLLDTSELDFEQTVEKVCEIINSKTK